MATYEQRKGRNGKDVYRVKVRRKGYRTQTKTFARLTDAKNWAQGIENDIFTGKTFPGLLAKQHTLAEAIDRYIKQVPVSNAKRLRDVGAKLAWWEGKMGHLKLAEVTKARLTACLDELAQKPHGNKKDPTRRLSPATINRYSAALGHCFSIAVREWEWMNENPFQAIRKRKEPGGRTRFLDEDERRRLIAALEDSQCSCLLAIVVVAISLGARQGEIMTMQWKDIDLETGWVVFPKTKNKQPRKVALRGRALEMIREINNNRIAESGPFVFPSPNDPCKPYYIRTSWYSALKKAEIQDFKFHDLRHTAASYLAMRGASIIELMEVLGHKSINMVRRYAHLAPGHTANIITKMNTDVFGS